MTISKEILDELLKGVERPEDLLGDAGLMKELKIKLMERMLGAELTQTRPWRDDVIVLFDQRRVWFSLQCASEHDPALRRRPGFRRFDRNPETPVHSSHPASKTHV